VATGAVDDDVGARAAAAEEVLEEGIAGRALEEAPAGMVAAGTVLEELATGIEAVGRALAATGAVGRAIGAA
jgi:hypothetical protein